MKSKSFKYASFIPKSAMSALPREQRGPPEYHLLWYTASNTAGFDKSVLGIRQSPDSVHITLTSWTPVEKIYPIGDLENDEIMLPFVVHDRDDISATTKVGTQKTIPRLNEVKLLIYGKRAPSRKWKYPISNRCVSPPV